MFCFLQTQHAPLRRECMHQYTCRKEIAWNTLSRPYKPMPVAVLNSLEQTFRPSKATSMSAFYPNRMMNAATEAVEIRVKDTYMEGCATLLHSHVVSTTKKFSFL